MLDFKAAETENQPECLQAVQEVHALGIAHRDIKLDNFCFKECPDDSSVLVLLDFRQSLRLHGDSLLRPAACLIAWTAFMLACFLKADKLLLLDSVMHMLLVCSGKQCLTFSFIMLCTNMIKWGLPPAAYVLSSLAHIAVLA